MFKKIKKIKKMKKKINKYWGFNALYVTIVNTAVWYVLKLLRE